MNNTKQLKASMELNIAMRKLESVIKHTPTTLTSTHEGWGRSAKDVKAKITSYRLRNGEYKFSSI